MLHFNEPWARNRDDADEAADTASPALGGTGGSGGDAEGGTEVWKVLIFDAFGRDVISPLLRVGELRENAVTLHMCVLVGPRRVSTNPPC